MSSSHDPSAPISSLEVVRHLFQRRWFILVLAPLFVLGVYAYTKVFMKNVYESESVLMLRTPVGSLRTGPQLIRLDPPSLPDLLLSDQIIFEVVQAARAKYPEFPQGDFENLKGLFAVRTVITRDTTTQATYSPAVILTVKYHDPQVAFFLADSWVRTSSTHLGELLIREAKAVSATTQERYDEFAVEALALTEKQTTLEIRREQLEALHRSRLGALLGSASETAGSEPEAPSGLAGEKLKLEFAAAQSPDDPIIQRSLVKVDELIQRTRAELEVLSEERKTNRNELEIVRRDLMTIREKMGQLRSVLTAMVAESVQVADPKHPENTGQLLILSAPRVPEVKVGPKRATLAIAGGGFLSGALILLLILELYLRRATSSVPA